MKKFINLTNHEINIITPEGFKNIPPSGQIARVNYSVEKIDECEGIPIYEIVYSDIVGLPTQSDDKIYIVSATVKNAVGLSRKDVVAPYDVERVNGKPWGCKAFRING